MPNVSERSWRVQMGERIWWVEADDYEGAVVQFEAQLRREGIKRTGAEFKTAAQIARERSYDSRPETLYACACGVRDDDPGMVVCWVCEAPVVALAESNTDAVLAANIIQKLVQQRETGRKALDRIARYGLGNREQAAWDMQDIARDALEAIDARELP